MEKLLLIGINTRSMLNSALSLNFEVFSTSYFSTQDTPQIKNQKIILKESDGESCGSFEEKFKSKNILDMSRDFIDEVDYIIPISGISPNDFSKKDQKKILGNKNTEKIEDKFRFYKEIKNEFLTPMTFMLNDIGEAIEIEKNYPENKFILKPLQGSGGYDINLLDNDSPIEINDNNKFIMQEYIEGINLSSSVLANGTESKTIMNSRLLTQHDFEENNSYIYVGNILPLDKRSIMSDVENVDEINEMMMSTSENIADKFNLIGSNGVDYIYNEDGLYVIEVNPRIQGTFECVERALSINMLDAHIKACQGEIMEMPNPKCYSYKKIIYSPCAMKYEKIDLDNIYDLPHLGSITEKSEPLLTIIDSDVNFEKLYRRVESASEKVNSVAKKHQEDVQ